MKKKLALAVLLSCVTIGSTSAVTYAYLTGQDRADNECFVSENEIHIEEKFDPPDEVEGGSVIKKSPCIANDSEIPVYVRLAVHFSDSYAQSLCEPLVIGAGWELSGDGYYYFGSALAPGARTVPLFEQIIIKNDVSKEELIPFDVLVYAESVPSSGLSMKESWSLYEGGAQ